MAEKESDTMLAEIARAYLMLMGRENPLFSFCLFRSFEITRYLEKRE